MARRQHEPTTEQQLRAVLRVLEAERRELAAIYVSMALDRLDDRHPAARAVR